MICLTRRYHFAASHRLHSPQLSEDANRELYGKCNNPFGHGHDYTLEVSVRGPIDRRTGRVVSLSALDRLVDEHVLRAFDHGNLNVEVPAFGALVPTSENLTIEIRDRLGANWKRAFPEGGAILERVRLHETRRNTFELTGTV